MTATNHAITGAVVALLIKRPEFAVPASLASHFVIDSLPHFKVSGMELARNRKKLFWVVNFLDLFIASCLLVLLPILLSNVIAAWVSVSCILTAILPDFAWVYRLVGEMKDNVVKQKNWLNRFHARIQWSETQPGIIVELVWFGLMWFVLVWKI